MLCYVCKKNTALQGSSACQECRASIGQREPDKWLTWLSAIALILIILIVLTFLIYFLISGAVISAVHWVIGDYAFSLLKITVLVMLGLFVYFMPSLTAIQKGSPQLQMVFMLNLLLGWSILGWIGAMVLAHYRR